MMEEREAKRIAREISELANDGWNWSGVEIKAELIPDAFGWQVVIRPKRKR